MREETIEELQQKSSVMFSVSKEKRELSAKTLETGADVVQRLSENLFTFKDNATTEKIENAGT